jgi:hypothetical protein
MKKLTWKGGFFIILAVLVVMSGFNLYTYYSMKNANHELSTALNAAKNVVEKLRTDNAQDVATLKEAQKNAQIVLDELDSMDILNASQKEHLEKAAGSSNKIQDNIQDTQQNTDNIEENIDSVINIGKSNDEIFNDIDNILKKYGL